jgi:predicted RNA methylase
MTTPEINDHIKRLDSADPRQRREAGDSLLAIGPGAVPALVATLAGGAPEARKAAAFVLGALRAHDPEALTALELAARDDDEPKVRKNAAVAVGRIAAPESAGALVEALQRETVEWVRPSILLALGAVGGESALAALEAYSPADEPEAEALHKALDKLAPRARDAAWSPEGSGRLPLLLETPIGLESVARDEARGHGIRLGDEVAPGLLRCPPGTQPAELLPALRCAFGPLIEAASGPPLPTDTRALADALAHMIAESEVLSSARRWLRTGGEAIRYRFSLRFGVRREELRELLRTVRAACTSLGLFDSPSNYDIELLADTDERGSRLLVRPSFMPDERFAYRRRDVGASIDPVVGACLARLARAFPRAQTFDPTCGSGTLLIERALLDPGVELAGLDISPTANAAAEANIAAASLSRRIAVEIGDAADLRSWPHCDEVLANLPFGLRTRGRDDLPQLYGALVANLADSLRPGGRAVLYTSAMGALDRSLAAERDRLRVQRHLRVRSGGLAVGVWVVEAI